MLEIFTAERFFLIHNPGDGKTFSLFLFSFIDSLLRKHITSIHTYIPHEKWENHERERAISMWEGEGKLENFPWAFFSWTSSSVVWGKNSALLVRDPRTHKTGKNRKKEEKKAKIINLWSKWRNLLKFYAIFQPFTQKVHAKIEKALMKRA